MIEKVVLDNGTRLLMEEIPYVRSAKVGVWTLAGSVNETSENSGVSHFLEHILFKGTTTKSGIQIAQDMDAIGGQLNAFTSKECTCYHVKTLDYHLEEAFLTVSDMINNPLIAKKDIIMERGVIKEEIDMYEDSPEDLCIDAFHEKIWEGGALANNILGSKKSVNAMTKKTLSEYMEKNYTPENTVISIVGSFKKDDVIKMAQKNFGHKKQGEGRTQPQTSEYKKTVYQKNKKIEQNHLALAFNGYGIDHSKIYEMSVLSNILGGAASSRLFQEIREKRGLAYSVYAFSTSYKENGLFTVYSALNKKSQKETFQIIREELQKLKEFGVLEEEFARGKEQIKANLIMSFESISTRMGSMARGELFKGRVTTIDQTIEKLDKITKESVDSVAKEIFDFDNMSMAVVGDTNERYL